MAIGVKPSHTPADTIKRQYAFDILGDAATVGKLLDGMTNAFEAANRI